jgi:hypothetical protein
MTKFAISPGNSKLGLGVWTFSIPSGSPHICVGATTACLKHCYAQKGHFLQQAVQHKYQSNYELSLTKSFVSVIGSELRAVCATVVRIHPSGEFYSAEYVDKWAAIARNKPKITFFAYTRSWAAKDLSILSALTCLSRLPNVRLWFSFDATMGEPPKIKGIRRAYMLEPDGSLPASGADLVFRVKRKTVQKRVEGVLVCPSENGVTKTTCTACKLCYSDRLIQLK